MKPFSTKYLFSSLSLVFLIFGFWFFYPSSDEKFPIIKDKLKGVCWVGGREGLKGGELKNLASIGANAMSQTPFGWQSDPNSPEIRWSLEDDRKWWGESGRGLEATLDSGNIHQISTMLKPHLWVRGAWPGEIEMKSETDWQLWFEEYEAFILDYANFAERTGMPFFCIGTELEKSSHRTADWKKIIQAIRKVYSGQLTYAANFTEFEQVEFWTDLDFIGIQAYFPLSEKDEPQLKDLLKSWRSHLKIIESTVIRFQKPVIFTEIGYCNTADAAREPWVWPNERKETALSEAIQALCYEAFFQSVWEKDWLAGVYFWKWYPDGKRRDPDFTPQGLQAEEVLRHYFSNL